MNQPTNFLEKERGDRDCKQEENKVSACESNVQTRKYRITRSWRRIEQVFLKKQPIQAKTNLATKRVINDRSTRAVHQYGNNEQVKLGH
jgi:hypothetical protein